MKKAILATKVGMTQVFNDDGALVPVTVLQAGPCVVTRVKTKESDGYDAVQVAFGEIRAKLVNKPDAGQLEKAGIEKKTVTRGEGKREIYEAGTESTRPQSPRAKASRASSRDWASTADR